MVASLQGRQPRRKSNVHCWKPLLRNTTEDTGLSVIVTCKVCGISVYVSNKSNNQSKTCL
jgi:hypothetical protein